ncbi:MAG: hypothetical protein M3545_01305 [Acidobacteriota bacterium]|nr:hypothetical protein [Acidobacteriota bacterium]
MRMLTLGITAAILVTAAAPSRAAARLDEAGVQAILTSQHRHVRAVDQRLTHAIADGLRRSSTFTGLVLALDRSDVIVYIETAPGMPASVAGRMLLAAGPSTQRYLRIQIAGGVRGNELIALLAHELQHALEVAESPAVRDERTLIALYETIGHPGSAAHRYDTMAAQDTGRRVRLELIG